MNRQISTGDKVAYLNSPELMRPAGHYSHACVAGGVVYVSGQLPIDKAGAVLNDQSFEVQAKQVLANLVPALRRRAPIGLGWFRYAYTLSICRFGRRSTRSTAIGSETPARPVRSPAYRRFIMGPCLKSKLRPSLSGPILTGPACAIRYKCRSQDTGARFLQFRMRIGPLFDSEILSP